MDGLRRLRAAGVRIITIANFSSKMLQENARHAGIEDLFDELVSTEGNQTYKPENSAYAFGLSHLGLKKEEVVFAAFGAWDYYGAKTFGYPTYWVNRFRLPAEELGTEPDGSSDSMEGLLRFVLGEGHTQRSVPGGASEQKSCGDNIVEKRRGGGYSAGHGAYQRRAELVIIPCDASI